MLRLVSVSRAVVARAPAAVRSVRMFSSELTDAEFDAKWTNYFDDKTLTQREVRSGLNDVFAHDAVPARPVLEAALRATRRVNDFPTSVRIFEGIKDKAQNEETYKQVVASLRPVIAELQLSTPEEIGFA